MRLTIFLTLFALFTLEAAPVAVAEEETVSVEDFFAGKVEKWKGRRIHLVYEFTDPKVLGDFDELNPFLAPQKGGFTAADGQLSATGVGMLLHKGVFEADVTVTTTMASETPKDIGVVLVPPEGPEQFLLFSLSDTYFSLRDRQTPNQHMITVVGARDASARESGTLFRYLQRSLKPKLAADKPVEIVVRKIGERNRLEIGGSELTASDRYGKFPEVQPGLFVLDSSFTVKRVTINGRLSAKWLEKVKIAFDPKEKDDEAVEEIEEPGSAVEVKPEDDPPARPGGVPPFPGGNSGAMGLVRTLRNSSAADAARDSAAKELTKENVKLDELRALIDALMDEDETSRTLSFGVLKRVTGKSFGYHPRAAEKDRRESFRAWFSYMMANRDRYR